MKKLVLLLVCMFTMHTMVMADNDKPIQVNQLPAKAQTFLNTYFKDHKVALAKQETELFYKSYDVVFTNGEKVEINIGENENDPIFTITDLLPHLAQEQMEKKLKGGCLHVIPTWKNEISW